MFEPRPAAAEPPSPASDAATLSRIGDGARLAGRFADAEASYRASLLLRPDDATELSLALALAAQGKARAAAPLLARLSRVLPPGERERAARALSDAKRELATVTVDVDVTGASLEVDGVPCGLSPLAEPLFLDAGPHTVRADRKGHQGSLARFDAAAGRAYTVELDLEPLPAEKAAAPSAPPPPPAAARAPTGTFLLGTAGVARAAGIAIGATALVGGVAAIAVAEVNNATARTKARSLASQDSGACRAPTGADRATCAAIESAREARDVASIAAATLFVGAGLAGAATLLSVVLFPPPEPRAGSDHRTRGARESQEHASGGPIFTLTPLAGPAGGGVSLEALW